MLTVAPPSPTHIRKKLGSSMSVNKNVNISKARTGGNASGGNSPVRKMSMKAKTPVRLNSGLFTQGTGDS